MCKIFSEINKYRILIFQDISRKHYNFNFLTNFSKLLFKNMYFYVSQREINNLGTYAYFEHKSIINIKSLSIFDLLQNFPPNFSVLNISIKY